MSENGLLKVTRGSSMKRTTLLAAVLFGVVASPGIAAPARRALPPPKPEMPYFPVFCAPRVVSGKFGAFEAAHTARRGELIVPPRDYASGMDSPQAPGMDGSGVYDIAFLGIDSDGVMLELRDYASPEARDPKAMRAYSYPVGTRSLQLRHIVVSIRSVSDMSMAYSVKIAPAVPDDPADSNEGGSATEEMVLNDYCARNGMPGIDVVEPTRR